MGDPNVKLTVENIKDQNEDYSGAAATFTYQDGLIIRLSPNMEIIQTRKDSQRNFKQKVVDLTHDINDDSKIEIKRVITKQGTVIRYMKNNSIQILFANGNFSIYDPKNKTWTKTKNSGERAIHKIDAESNKVIEITEIESLEVKTNIDPETNQDVEIRSDGVMIVHYKDGATLVLHHDNTKIFKKTEETIVEKENFAPVRIRFSTVKSRAQTVIGMGGTNALIGIDDIMERSHDGYVMETYLPDDTIVESYREKQSLEGFEKYSHNTIHLIRKQDFSIIKVKQEGEVVIITSNQRAYLNDIGDNCELGKDKDYFFELYGHDNDRRNGVYTCNVAQGTIKTTDDESNIFIVYANGESIEKLAVTFNLDETAETFAKKKPCSPRNIPDGEYIDEESKFLVPPKSVMHPRLLFIKNDGSGYEFYNNDQLEYYFRVREVDKKSLNEKHEVNIGTERVSLLTSLTPVKEISQKTLISKACKIPQNVSEAIQTVCIPSEPAQNHYLTEKLIQFEEFSETDVDKFEDSMERYYASKQMQAEELQSLS